MVEEERVACNQQVDLVAERVEDARGGVPVALHGGRHLHLPGPAYWKYKKPKQPDWGAFFTLIFTRFFIAKRHFFLH